MPRPKRPIPLRRLSVDADESVTEPAIEVPSDWQHGAMLNVRNAGHEYRVTLFPDEDDYRHPERTLRFQNSALCQEFVSRWYAREHHDGRA